MTSTQAVLEFLEGTDLELWRKNLPVTGDVEVDTPVIKKAIWGYALSGTKTPIWEAKTSEDYCGTLAWKLAEAAMENVDWAEVLKRWQ